MGLDVSAYSKLTKTDAVFDDEGEAIDPMTREVVEYDLCAYVNPEFPGRADDVEHKGIYRAEEADSFYSGAYSSYNRWRDQLAQLAGYPLGEYEEYGRKRPSYCVACWGGAQGPFAELINFSDCEGVIGAAVSAKLAKDFADFQEKADAIGDPSFIRVYAAFRKSFEMAADGGCVQFH